MSRCLDHHIPRSQAANRLVAEKDMHDTCHLGAEPNQQQGRLQARQIESIISAIQSAVSGSTDPFPQTSFLDQTNSLGVVTGIPTDVNSIISQPAAITPQPTSNPSALTSDIESALSSLSAAVASDPAAASSVAAVMSTTNSGRNAVSSSNTASSTTPASQSTADTSQPPTLPPSSGGSSPGLIAGAVIGSVAVLILVGILIVLVLRHRKKSSNTTPLVENKVEGGADKEVYHGQPQDRQPVNEMSTNANAWEMEGHGHSTPWELEAAQRQYGRGN
jgi:hypothetical protein